MTTRYYIVKMDIAVFDSKALFGAALLRAVEEGFTEEGAHQLLKPDGVIDVDACLKLLLDPDISPPGCRVNDVSSEAYFA